MTAISTPSLKKLTRNRRFFAFLSSFLFLISVIFTIFVEIGNLHRRPVLSDIYFIKLDLSHIIPGSVPNAALVNSIARTLGLHDFYQVGLWGFCEGYGDEITNCSKPKALYWFNPVAIILDELLAGATIALPNNVTSALTLIRTASHWMFALFLLGASLSFLSIFLVPLSIRTRWASLPLTLLTFLAAFATTAAAVIATAMFIIFRKVIHDAEDTVNIQADIGTEMFAFVWIAAGSALLGWAIQFGECCCCRSERDVRTGRRMGRRNGREDGDRAAGVEEKPEGKKGFRRRWISDSG